VNRSSLTLATTAPANICSPFPSKIDLELPALTTSLSATTPSLASTISNTNMSRLPLALNDQSCFTVRKRLISPAQTDTPFKLRSRIQGAQWTRSLFLALYSPLLMAIIGPSFKLHLGWLVMPTQTLFLPQALTTFPSKRKHLALDNTHL
jgi:hypothetical protein